MLHRKTDNVNAHLNNTHASWIFPDLNPIYQVWDVLDTLWKLNEFWLKNVTVFLSGNDLFEFIIETALTGAQHCQRRPSTIELWIPFITSFFLHSIFSFGSFNKSTAIYFKSSLVKLNDEQELMTYSGRIALYN